jgi:hypothetical protein
MGWCRWSLRGYVFGGGSLEFTMSKVLARLVGIDRKDLSQNLSELIEDWVYSTTPEKNCLGDVKLKTLEFRK